MPKKPTKSRANKYQEKVKVDATFNELMKELFPSVKIDKNEALRKSKKKKLKK